MGCFPSEMWMLDTVNHSSDISSRLGELSSHAKWCVCITTLCQQPHAWDSVTFYRWINWGTGIASPLSIVTHPSGDRERGGFSVRVDWLPGSNSYYCAWVEVKSLWLVHLPKLLTTGEMPSVHFPARLRFTAQYTSRGGSDPFPLRQLEISLIGVPGGSVG